MRILVALAVLMVVALTACNQSIGSSADPSRASTCSEVADVAINQLRGFVDQAVGDQSYEEFLVAFDDDGGEAFAAASEAYSEESLALDARRTELACAAQEFQDLLCARLADVEAGGTAAEQLLAPSRAACG